MVLSVVLDNPKPVWHAEDVMKGQVVLHSTKEEAVGSIVITFYGRAKTKIKKRKGNTTHTYRGRGNLFYYSLVSHHLDSWYPSLNNFQITPRL
jgi:hypothetical protein